MTHFKVPVELRRRQLELRIQLLSAVCRSDNGKSVRAREARGRVQELERERGQLQLAQRCRCINGGREAV